MSNSTKQMSVTFVPKYTKYISVMAGKKKIGEIRSLRRGCYFSPFGFGRNHCSGFFNDVESIKEWIVKELCEREAKRQFWKEAPKSVLFEAAKQDMDRLTMQVLYEVFSARGMSWKKRFEDADA